MASPRSAAVLQPYIDRGELVGAVTLVADRDGVLDLDAAGSADLAVRTPMQPDAMFWIASQTKPITGTALMMLVDAGKVDVDDPVEKYLPEFAGQKLTEGEHESRISLVPPTRPIAVRDVLSHTSGLPFGSLIEHPTRDVLPLWATVRSYAMLPLLTEPGTRYLYSNAGTNTAGRIIEVVTGEAYEDFLQTRLFDPLGMTDTTFWPDAGQVARLAKHYRAKENDGGLVEAPIKQLRTPLTDRTRRFAVPGGGLFSTAADCAKFCRMILGGGTLDGRRYLSETAVREMTRRQTPAAVAESYGFGWQVYADDGHQFGHGGACETRMVIDTRRGLVTVFLVQVSDSDRTAGAVAEFQRAAEETFGARR